MLHIFVDADACPVKQEIYRVADRYRLKVTVVSNTLLKIPDETGIKLEIVKEGMDVADDWIVEHLGKDDLVITADILLAGRCIKKYGKVISPAGKIFSEINIGEAVAMRDLFSDLRGAGEITSGPPPFSKKDRSNFLQKLDEMIQAIRRKV